MSTVQFPSGKQEDLIRAVECRPAIYNKADENHSNRDFISGLWCEISDEVKCEASLCKTKWQNLRDYYIKRERQIEKWQRKGLPPGRPWFLHKKMSFLSAVLGSRKTVKKVGLQSTEKDLSSTKKDVASSPGEVEMEDSDEEFELKLSHWRSFKSSPESVYSASAGQGDNDPSQSCSDSKKRKMDSAGSDVVADSNFSSTWRESEDEHELFFRSLIPSVSQLDEINTMCFRAEVQQLAAKYLRQQRGIVPNECASCNSNKDPNTTLN